jgi:HSP20 family protein
MVWDIFDEMRKMQEEMDRIFGEFFARPAYPGLGPSSSVMKPQSRQIPGMREPCTDVQETDKDVIITAELPGIDTGDIQLTVTSERLEITAEKKKERAEEKEGYRTYGRKSAGFFRSVPLPGAVKTENARATYKNGVLEIILPKREATESRHIKID